VLEKIPPVSEEMLKNLIAMCHGPVQSVRPLFVAEILHLWRAGYTPADRQTSWGVLHPY
jgi:hypothetical protein